MYVDPSNRARYALLRFARRARLRGMLLASWLAEIHTATRTRRDLAIREILPGTGIASGSRDLVVFAHFDKHGVIDPHVLHYVRKLRETGRDIIFVSSSPHLGEPGLSHLREICREVVHRLNRGYDFGSFKTGIARAGDLSQYDSLILANDSVYGPLFDLGEMIDGMRMRGADFWGVTDSDEARPHLQSYFIFFEKPVLESQAFTHYWKHLPLYEKKLTVIRNGEIGLSGLLLRMGFRHAALATTDELRKREPNLYAAEEYRSAGGDPNISRIMWRQLIEQFRVPLLKVDIVRDLPGCATGIDNWREVVTAQSDYDCGLIDAHLLRLGAQDALKRKHQRDVSQPTDVE